MSVTKQGAQQRTMIEASKTTMPSSSKAQPREDRIRNDTQLRAFARHTQPRAPPRDSKWQKEVCSLFGDLHDGELVRQRLLHRARLCTHNAQSRHEQRVSRRPRTTQSYNTTVREMPRIKTRTHRGEAATSDPRGAKHASNEQGQTERTQRIEE